MIRELDNRLKKIERLLEERHHNEVIYLNIEEASQFIKMKKTSIYQLVYQRKIPFYKRGKILLFKKSELVQWIENERKETLEELIERNSMKKIIDRYKDERNSIEKWKNRN